MYLIFERESGILQFSFCNYNESIFLRAFIIHSIEDKLFTCNKKYFIFFNDLPIKSTQILDYRFIFKNNTVKEFIYFLFFSVFVIFNFVKKILNDNILKKIFIWIFALFFLFDFSSRPEISLVNNIYKNQDFLAWKNHFIKTKTAQKIAFKKHFSLTDKIPQIRGIWDFKVIPLTAQASADDSYSGFIALPYSAVISIQGKYILIKRPIESCEENQMHVFAINEKDELLLLESTKLISRQKKDHFILFSTLELKRYAQEFANYCAYIKENAGDFFEQ
ncbi:hypothetical protein [Fluviispira vulneris]|uniref:hypothetical protein n=1 Tax=Fluviispira vulneris TaxID=2763012 RepID=UPI001645D9B4|nr:hypothetical protein [Fluviispira vulneris]